MSVESGSLAGNTSKDAVVLDIMIMEQGANNQNSLDGSQTMEKPSNNPDWFQGVAQGTFKSDSTLGTANTGSVNLHSIGGRYQTSHSFKDLQKEQVHIQLNLNAAAQQVKELQSQLANLRHDKPTDQVDPDATAPDSTTNEAQNTNTNKSI